jgi:hypothetical protein
LEQTERLITKYYGYSLRSYSSLKIEKIGIANCMVVIVMAYMMSKVTKGIIQFIFIFINKSEELSSQLRYQIDISRHLKQD